MSPHSSPPSLSEIEDRFRGVFLNRLRFHVDQWESRTDLSPEERMLGFLKDFCALLDGEGMPEFPDILVLSFASLACQQKRKQRGLPLFPHNHTKQVAADLGKRAVDQFKQLPSNELL